MDSASLSKESKLEALKVVGIEALWLKGLEVLDVWTSADMMGEQVIGSSAVRFVPGWDEASDLRGEGVSGWMR